jgi:N-acetylmuramoyl-L-alanine amidase
MNIIDQPSPNCNSRENHAIDMLVLHYTGMKTMQDALDRLCDPMAEVSAHYMIDEDGTVYRLVPEEMRAWHAGKSAWRGQENINQRSIGIELVNPGHEFGYRAFPKAQMEALAVLCKDILSRHNIPARNILAHSDVAPERKEDPGELFDWEWLAGQGVGLFPSPLVGEGGAKRRERGLELYGYDTTDLPKAILAFQRHFRPKLLNGQWDNECEALLAALLQIV